MVEDKSKKIISIIAIMVICSLLIINSYMFVSLKKYDNSFTINSNESRYLYCKTGVYQTLQYNQYKYGIQYNDSDFMKLSNVCYRIGFERIAFDEIDDYLFNISKEGNISKSQIDEYFYNSGVGVNAYNNES